MAFNEWCFPFAQLTHRQKKFPCKDGALRSVNCKKSSTPFLYSSVTLKIKINLVKIKSLSKIILLKLKQA